MISRTVYGAADDSRVFPSQFTSMNGLGNITGYQYFSQFYSEGNPGGFDSEYDIFSYYFGTKSGKFVLSPDRDSAYLMPEAPLNFFNAPGSQGFPSSVLDEKGNLFEFGQEDDRATVPSGGTYLTGRLLTRIISANKQDTITFSYSQRAHLQASTVAEVTIIDNNTMATYIPGGQYSMLPYRVNTANIQYSAVQRLKLIKFREGYVRFMPHTQAGQWGRTDTTDRISSIQLLDRRGQLLKTVRLQMSPLGYSDAGPVSKLDQLLFQDRAGETVERYAFDYYPDPTFNNWQAAGGVDFWGFLNGYNAGNTSGPSWSIPYYSILVQPDQPNGNYVYASNMAIGGADRQPNPLWAQSGVLRRITYPTGGSTEFKYEGNRAQRGAQLFNCPGLRVAQSVTRDSVSGPPQIRTFRYGPLTTSGSESGYGDRAYLTIEAEDMSYEMRYFPSITTYTPSGGTNHGYNGPPSQKEDFRSYRKRTYSSQFLPGIREFANDPTYYTTVTEYRGLPIGSAGKTVYHYSAPAVDNIAHYPTPTYPLTIPFTYGMVPPPWPYLVDQNLRVPYIAQVNQWNKSRLTEKTEYKYMSASQSYQPVHTMAYNYQATPTKMLRGQHLYRNMVVGNQSSYYYITRQQVEQYISEVCDMPLFSFAEYLVTLGRVQLESTTERFYDAAAPFTKTTTYAYNDYQLPKRQEVTANGKTLITQTTYPFDTPTTPVHQQMLAQHQLDYPVEQRTYAGLQPLTTTATQYQAVMRNGVIFFAPAQVLTATGTDPLRPRLLFDDWDSRGNLTDQHPQLGTPEAYRWGYDGRYPVAHLVNARHRPTTGAAEFYAETFEEHPTRSTSHAQTGKYGSNGNAFTVTFTAPASRAYVIDWQQWDNGRWVYHREPYAGKTFAAGTYVDDVRVYPTDAQISTYTYEPLVGVTSQTDPNGRSTRYEYDAYGRLSRVRNHLGQILSQQQYHYLGRP